MLDRPAYSYRDDSAVPAFPDDGPVVFMDAECAFCTRGARTISTLDTAEEFRICPTNNAIGRAVLTHYGLDPEDPDSWLLLENGRAYCSLDAIIRVGRRLGGWGHVIGVAGILPRAAQDWIYRRIARNRYSILGKTDMCAVPDAKLQRRLIQ